MFLVGLTGGIASGKSSVIQVFQQLGCAVIDIDVIARQGESEGLACGLVHSGSLVLPFFHHAPLLLRPQEGRLSCQPWSAFLLPTPACPLLFCLTFHSPHLTHDQHEGGCALFLHCFPSSRFVFTPTERSTPGFPCHFASSHLGPLAGLEPPESDPASSSCLSCPARTPSPPAHRGGLWH